uniref:Eukaryotic translation initiation factor 4E binding protein 1 n=1 Tax=Junco hyemalis TaxID=40217 RepID=A0A8C5ILG9_JUNHY
SLSPSSSSWPPSSAVMLTLTDCDGMLSPPGTRIIYDRKFLMECRNSPGAKTPPSDLPDIPGVTSPSVEELKVENHHVQSCEEKVSAAGEEEQFDMDI